MKGLILTSPRAVTAIAMLKNQNPCCLETWIKQPAFCIGHTTENFAKEQLGLINTLGTESGNAKNLANFIVNTVKKNYSKPFLLPCSDIARDTIPQILSENGMEVEKIVVYKTKAHENLKEKLQLALKLQPNILVFFSPSTVENIVITLNHDKSIFGQLKIIAIGPVTERALFDSSIKVHGVAEKPEPKALTEVILKLV